MINRCQIQPVVYVFYSEALILIWSFVVHPPIIIQSIDELILTN